MRPTQLLQCCLKERKYFVNVKLFLEVFCRYDLKCLPRFKSTVRFFSFFERRQITHSSIHTGGVEVCKLILRQQKIITIEKKRQNVFANVRRLKFRSIRLVFEFVFYTQVDSFNLPSNRVLIMFNR